MNRAARRALRLAAATATTGAMVVATANPAVADIQGYRWADTAMQLTVGVNSNQVGFWQTLLYSNGFCDGFAFDGKFGTPDKSATISFQAGVLGYPLPGRPADGVVGWRTYDDTQSAHAPGGFPRLSTSDGYFYDYYGGLQDGELFWQTGSSGKWKYRHPINGTWYVATNSLTQPSLTC